MHRAVGQNFDYRRMGGGRVLRDIGYQTHTIRSPKAGRMVSEIISITKQQ